MKSIKKGIADLTIIKLMKIVIPLLCAPYVSRKLGVDNIGIYSFTDSVSAYFCLLAALGTYTYGKREVSRNRDNIKVISQLFVEIEIVSVVSTFSCMLIWTLVLILSRKYTLYLAILTINILAVAFDVAWFYEGLEKFKSIIVVGGIVKVLGVVSIVLCVKTPNDLWKYILIVSLVTFFSNFFLFVDIFKYIKLKNLCEIHIRKHIKETLIYFVPTIATSVYTVLDKTFLGIFANDTYSSGCYEQALRIINLAKGIAFASINTALGIRTSYLFKDSKYEEVEQLINYGLDLVSFLSIGCMFGIGAIAPGFVPLFFGDGFEGAISIMRIFSPIIYVIGISDCLGMLYYTPVGKRKISSRYIIVGAFTNVCLNILFIPHFKAEGAAVASVLAELVIAFLYIRNSAGYCSFQKLFVISRKKIVAGLVMATFVYFIGKIQLNILARVIVQVVFGGATYVALLVLLKDDVSKIIFGLIKH